MPIIGASAATPFASNAAASNPMQPTAGPNTSLIGEPGSTNRGLCSINYGGNIFRFRTNPNEINWDYELITHVDETYGGRVIQLLGTRLGDLNVTIEAGLGAWPYVMKTVNYLRQMMIDQRGGSTGTFEYTTRNWKLKVYAMSIPFQDEVTATTRSMVLNFKIQEDVNGIVSQATLAAEFAKIADGTYLPSQKVHNQFNDSYTGAASSDTGAGPQYSTAGSPTNTVDQQVLGQAPAGIPGFDIFSSIPGIGALLGGGG